MLPFTHPFKCVIFLNSFILKLLLIGAEILIVGNRTKQEKEKIADFKKASEFGKGNGNYKISFLLLLFFSLKFNFKK